MASIFTHAFTAIAIGKTGFDQKMTKKMAVTGMLCSIIPDADVMAFRLGISYENLFGHRGITHSILFALLLSVGISWLGFRKTQTLNRWLIVAYLFLCTLSHGILDAMTDGGLGVAFLAPLSEVRYFLPWRPIQVSPIGIDHFFGAWGLRVIISELLWVWLPLGAFWMGCKILKTYRNTDTAD